MKQYFCVGSYLPFESINKSQLNNSKAKQTFSFGRSKRFEQNRANCKVAAYSTSQFKFRKEGGKIGSSKRQPMVKINDYPSPGRYRVKTQVTDLNSSISFGMGRQDIKAYDYLNIQAKEYPSSTKYQVANNYKKLYKNAPVYSMRKRYATQHQEQGTPGPAKYSILTSKITNLQLTKYKSVSFSTGKSKRFNNEETQPPGPGAYKVPDVIMERYGGSSRYHSSLANKFTHALRKTYIDDQTKKGATLPGPGNYKTASEFGQYDGDVYKTFELAGRNFNDTGHSDSEAKGHFGNRESKRPMTSKS